MKANSKFFRKLGALKVYGDVARYYISLVQFIIIIAGVGKIYDLAVMSIVQLSGGFFIIMIILVWLHVKYIMPNEMRYLNERNPATRQLLKNTGDGKIDY